VLYRKVFVFSGNTLKKPKTFSTLQKTMKYKRKTKCDGQKYHKTIHHIQFIELLHPNTPILTLAIITTKNDWNEYA
jgi:hypothetical protein